MAGADQYTVWTVDNHGNYTATIIGPVSGTTPALESIETTFGQDLNGDGTIGLVSTQIGSGTLTVIGNQYYLNERRAPAWR